MNELAKEQEVPQEILDQTFQIDGYDFGDRLMEGVIYNYEVSKDLKPINIRVDEEFEDYFKQFNTEYWYNAAEKSIQWHLDVCKEALGRGVTWAEMIQEHKQLVGPMSYFFAEF